MDRFQSVDQGPANYILGLKIDRNRIKRTLYLSQELYAEKVLASFNMSTCKPVRTPNPVDKLSKADCPTTDYAKAAIAKDCNYGSIVGSLIYAAISTRPDISHPVDMLSRYMSNPGPTHCTAAKTVLRYLRGTSKYGLKFTGYNTDGSIKSTIISSAFCDSDYAGDMDKSRSTSGYLIYVAGNLVSWLSKRQPTNAQSSAEAEYYSAGECIKELIWTNNLLSELGFSQSTPSIMYGDNQSALSFANAGKLPSRIKHIDNRVHSMIQWVNNKIITLKWIRTDSMIADILTKPLQPKLYEPFRDRIVAVSDD
jgi:hypothetical protein